MNDSTVVEIEPNQLQRRNARIRAEQLQKADLSAIAGDEMLVLAASIGNSVIRGLELKERKRVRRILLFIAGGAVTLVGVVGLAMQFLMRN